LTAVAAQASANERLGTRFAPSPALRFSDSRRKAAPFAQESSQNGLPVNFKFKSVA